MNCNSIMDIEVGMYWYSCNGCCNPCSEEEFVQGAIFQLKCAGVAFNASVRCSLPWQLITFLPSRAVGTVITGVSAEVANARRFC